MIAPIAPLNRIDRNSRGEVIRVTPVRFIGVKDIRPLNLKQMERAA